MIGNSYQGQSRNNPRFLTPFGIGAPGAPVQGNGGGTLPNPFFRNTADYERSAYRRVPSAAYPDGYLGTINTRRGDRILDSLKSRVGQRNYQRGVHKGERIDPGDYLYPSQFTPQDGLRAEARGQRWAPIGQYITPLAEGLMGLEANLDRTPDPRHALQLRRLAPTWRY